MLVDEEPWQRLLCDALSLLALPHNEQVRVNGPGCVACDLLNDFDHARIVALGKAKNISEEQRKLLERIDSVMGGMQQPDLECFDIEVLQRPVWHDLRELAAASLQAFGWDRVVVRPFTEVEPGVCYKPYAEPGPTNGTAQPT